MVAASDLWPRLLPIMGRLVPPDACQLPSVRRRSCIRRSWIPARSRIRFHAFFGSIKWPLAPLPGNTHSPWEDAFRLSRMSTAVADNATARDSPFFVSGIVHVAVDQFISFHRIAWTLLRRAPVRRLMEK